MDGIPSTIALTRPTAKKVKWAFRHQDGATEEWSEWTPACSAEHLIVTMSEKHPDDEGIRGLSANILCNMFGRGVREGKRQSSRKALPENLQITKV
jgi:hypothetical protein